MNTNKKTILLINKTQFGYHTDTYKYCENLIENYNVTYICFDTNKPKQELNDVNVIYIEWKGSIFKKGFRFIQNCIKEIGTNRYNVIFCVYFQGSCILTWIHNKSNLILDIRTGYVGKSKIKKYFFNTVLRIETLFFKNITIISNSLAKKLKLAKFEILPLGSDNISNSNKSFKQMNLLYVGTLTNRNIHQIVQGFDKFNVNQSITCTLDIFGSGMIHDLKQLENSILNSKNKASIQFHGFKTHSEIQSFFDNCNIGISFIPKTDYFDCQPPTKTYEYLNSGMICIATSTSENKCIIKTTNGILCEDNSDSFFIALTEIKSRLSQFDSNTIRQTTCDYTWNKIVLNILIPILNKTESK